MLANIKDAATG